jgi:hypothetical protein
MPTELKTWTPPSSENWNAWDYTQKDRFLRNLARQRAPGLESQESPIWTPFPDKAGQPSPQRLAYESQADVVGYGGAAGGGKTDLALGLAITRHQRSQIFRRESTQLRAIIDRAHEILGGRGRFNDSAGIWRDDVSGCQIEFCGCKDSGDEQKYRGRPKDLMVLDEADGFLEFQFRFLAGWVRTTTPGQRCRILLTFNPPSTAEGMWVTRYFAPWIDCKHARPAKHGELRWYAMVDGEEIERPDGRPFRHGDEVIQPQSRTFIGARLIDNPKLMATGYGATLQALREPLRSQLLFGDFAAGIRDDAWQVIPTEWVRAAMARWKPERPDIRLGMTCLGVDVARGGDDKTVLAPRYGHWYGPLQRFPGQATPDGPTVVAYIALALKTVADARASVNIDIIGPGGSVYDFACRAHYEANAINFATAVEHLDRSGKLAMGNLRAWAYWSLAEDLDPAYGSTIALPPDQELLADLTAARWKNGPRGVMLEPKEDITKRIGRSPDAGDAVAMAHLPPILAPRITIPEFGKGSILDTAPPGVFGTDERVHGQWRSPLADMPEW